MERKKRSIIWSLDRKSFADLVFKSRSIGEILKHFGLENKGGNSATVKRRIANDGLDASHIQLGKDSNKGRKFPNAKKIPLEEICVKNSSYNRNHLKKRLIKEKKIENKCFECGQLPMWNNKELVLQLEHKNGISNDHRIENLSLLCPNCHSQTPTFAGRKQRSEKHKLSRLEKRKTVRPSKEQLEKMLWKEPTTSIAKNTEYLIRLLRNGLTLMG